MSTDAPNTDPSEAPQSKTRAKNPFAVGVLQSFTPPAWLSSEDRLHGGDWWTGDYYIETAQRLEAAKVDFIFFHDTLAVARRSDGDMGPALKWAATAPAHDPVVLLPALAAATKDIGLVATASTTYNNPFQLARAFGTLDCIGGGRIGWNIVTTFESLAAENFGVEKLPGRDDRYDRADEFVELAKKLWTAWEPDAVIADLETDTYVDASKVHSVDHAGHYYRSRGPLNVIRSPQGVPYLAQAGSSERGLEFAAKHAELVFALVGDDPEKARVFREDIRARAERHGRDPDEIAVVHAVVINFTPEDWDPTQPLPITDAQFGSQLEWWSASLDIDLSAYPLDEPLPLDTEPPATGIRGMFDIFMAQTKNGKTVREAVSSFTKPGSEHSFRGTPEQVADKMVEFMNIAGGDGFMISREWDYNGEFMDTFTERLMPALQRSGATTTAYAPGETLRERMRSIKARRP